MKKRIIASTMASVMALSAGASMVASAAVADFKGAYATKADLRKLMQDAEIVDLVENDGLSNYGSISGANFLKAYDYANSVLDNADSTNDEATVAYLMIKATKDALKQYTKTDLQLLVSECRSKYDTENKLNEEGDAKYVEDDWAEFSEAFENADAYKEYDDILVTTDAYEALDAAKDLEEMPTKTKLQIEAAHKAYETAINTLEFKFQPWQRGTVSGTKTDYDGKTFAWGMLYQHVKGAKTLLDTTYQTFDEAKGLSITSNVDVVAAVDAMNEAAAVLNGFSANYETGSSGSAVNKLLGTYQGQLLYTYNEGTANAVLANFIAVTKAVGGSVEVKVKDSFKTTYNLATPTTYWNIKQSASTGYKPFGDNNSAGSVVKTIGAELVVRTQDNSDPIYYILDTNQKLPTDKGRLVSYNGTYFFASAEAAASAKDDLGGGTNLKVNSIKKNSAFTLSDVIKVDFDDVAIKLTSGTNFAAAVASTDVLPEVAATATTAVSDALDAVTTAATAIEGAASAAITSITAVQTAIEALVVGTTTGTNVSSQKVKDKLVAMASQAVADVTELESLSKALAAKTTTSTVTVNELEKINTLYGNLDVLLNALSAALVADGLADSTGSLDDVISTELAAIASEYTTASTGYFDAKDEYLAALVAAAEGRAVKTVNTFGTNKETYKANTVMDYAAEATFTQDEDGKETYGLQFFPDSTTSNAFNFLTGYTTSKTTDATKRCSDTAPILANALYMVKGFNDSGKLWQRIESLDNAGYVTKAITDGDAIQGRGWQILYTYLKYALEDEFQGTSELYTIKQIKEYIEKSYDLLEQTVDSSLFTASHMNLYDCTYDAGEWVQKAEAKATGEDYKDGETTYSVDSGRWSNQNSTKVYKDLKSAYDRLNKELSGFKYSYGDIIEQMAAIAKVVDGGSLDASTASKLTDELLKAAGEFVKVEEVMIVAANGKDEDAEALDDSSLFTDTGVINVNNRLFTNGSLLKSLYVGNRTSSTAYWVVKGKENGPNKTHYNMQTAYEKLVKDYEAAMNAGNTDTITTDVNGDGTFNLADITYMLKLFVDNTTDVKKHDFTGDGKVAVDDIVYLLKEFTKG